MPVLALHPRHPIKCLHHDTARMLVRDHVAMRDRRRRVVWYLALRSLHVAHERSEREVSEGVCLLEFYTE